jgi:hypothetical protein
MHRTSKANNNALRRGLSHAKTFHQATESLGIVCIVFAEPVTFESPGSDQSGAAGRTEKMNIENRSYL